MTELRAEPTTVIPAVGQIAGDLPGRPAADADRTTEFPAVALGSPLPPMVPAPVRETATQTITCPECGTLGTVSVNRRESSDFCRTCDYPLFWVPSRVILDAGDGSDGRSLRRLPGTVGRSTVASVTCPHCDEPNTVSALVCVRCGKSMHPELAAPPPEIVYVPTPAPTPVTEPAKSRIPWWVWVMAFFALSGVIALVTVLMFNELS
jgi:DNA-directed RNA polymerase subunit RPC12/RpoP